MKKKLILGFFLILLLFAGAAMMLQALVNRVNQIPISTPDFTEIPDGTYTGEYSIPPVRVILQVSVKEHRLTHIKIIEHEHGLGGRAETITDQILDSQSLEIDAVSGATVSSKCILKAVEDALKRPKGCGGIVD